jgi:hypothetical protein
MGHLCTEFHMPGSTGAWISPPLNGKLNRGFMQSPFCGVTLKNQRGRSCIFCTTIIDNLCIHSGSHGWYGLDRSGSG